MEKYTRNIKKANGFPYERPFAFLLFQTSFLYPKKRAMRTHQPTNPPPNQILFHKSF